MFSFPASMKEVIEMVRFVVHAANEPARRFKLLWTTVACGIAGVYVYIGSGYLVGGPGATTSNSLHLVSNIEKYFGRLHAHGAILMGLGIMLFYSVHEYRLLTRRVLQATVFYSALVATLLIGDWPIDGINWGGPGWYALVIFLSVTLLILSPPLNEHGELFAGEDGSEGA